VTSGQLQGYNCVVTGAARGLGAAAAEKFLAEGARVVIADIDFAAAQECAKRLDASGGRALAVACDVADPAACEALVASAEKFFGAPIDVFLSHAGMGFAGALVDTDVERIQQLCLEAGARSVRVAHDDLDRARLWQGRKKAFGAMGRVSSHLVVQDAVIPRTRLPDVLAAIHEISQRHRVKVCNVFHAGDGNLHPNIGYNAHDPDESARVELAMREIMTACINAGGTITGEHGVGLDKLPYMDLIFSPETLQAMCDLRSVFDPARRANPGKVVPMRSCREWTMTPAGRR
jgi:FAD/FMN-containing dehydrogenase